MEDVLQDLGKKIDRMIEDSQLSKIEWKKEIDQRVEEVRKNIDTIENKTKEVFGDREKWQDVEDKIRNATQEFREAVESAFNLNDETKTSDQSKNKN